MSTTLLRGRNVAERLGGALNHFVSVTPARFAIALFLGLITLFTILLSLPVMSSEGRITGLADALFTATSSVCVTGLATVDMSTHWSLPGQVVIVVGTQVGAVGVLTMASVMGLVVSRKLGLRQRLLVAGDVNPMAMQKGGTASGLAEVGGLLATVAVSMAVIEVSIGILIYPSILLKGVDPLTAAGDALIYSAMAFTNTGFILPDLGFEPFIDDRWFLSWLMVATFFGAIGFPVIYALSHNLRHPRRWTIHVKLTLVASVLLYILGAVVYVVLEWGNARSYGDQSPGDIVFESLFLSVMTRSGGFSTFDLSHLRESSLLVTDMLMFVGGGSASTAGGIKVTTLAVLFIAAYSEARGKASMEAFERKIPGDVLRLAVSVVLWGATTVAVACIILLQLTDAGLDFVLFDVISAFATVGLSTGFTETLDDPAKYVMSATMFMGRIGTVTLAAALAASQRRQLFTRAEERPIVG
jgi:trk system potassium uptake protein TrkH